MKRDLVKIEPAIEKLKKKAGDLQQQIADSADEGWTVLANLTDQLQEIDDEIEMKELEWLELAEELEIMEQEELTTAA